MPINFNIPKPFNWILAIVGSVIVGSGSVYGLLQLDDRYSKATDLEKAKVEIIEELRNEVARNRTIMIRNLEREKLDIEFKLETVTDSGESHYLRGKMRTIDLNLKELEGEND